MSQSVPGNSIVTAVTWVEHLLTGTLATALAVIAIAGLGYRLLAGQLEPRRALQVVLGIFILFGAATIARGLTDLASTERPTLAPAPPVTPPSAPPVPRAVDPYAGASVPFAN